MVLRQVIIFSAGIAFLSVFRWKQRETSGLMIRKTDIMTVITAVIKRETGQMICFQSVYWLEQSQLHKSCFLATTPVFKKTADSQKK